MDGTEYITLKEAGEISGYSPDYIGQLIRRGKLTGKQVYANVAWVTTKDALHEYLSEKGKTSKEAPKETPKDIKKATEVPTVSIPHLLTEREETARVSSESETTPSVAADLEEYQKWERFLRGLSWFVVVASAIFLILLLHVFSTLLDDRLEVRAMEHAAASESIYDL